jgi:uncharacterized protein (TIGR02246 family)
VKAAALWALLAVAGLAAAPAPPPREAVRTVREDWNRAYSAGDLERLMRLYAEDAVSMPPGAPALVGKAAIRADLAGFLAANRVHETAAVQDVMISGDLAVERAAYRAEITSKAGRRTVERGKHMVAYRRGPDGRWRVRWEIWNAD